MKIVFPEDNQRGGEVRGRVVGQGVFMGAGDEGEKQSRDLLKKLLELK